MDMTVNSAMALQDMSRPGDRFRLQVRLVGESNWADSVEHTDVFPADWSARLVRELNAVADGIVFRAVLVSHV